MERQAKEMGEVVSQKPKGKAQSYLTPTTQVEKGQARETGNYAEESNADGAQEGPDRKSETAKLTQTVGKTTAADAGTQGRNERGGPTTSIQKARGGD